MMYRHSAALILMLTACGTRQQETTRAVQPLDGRGDWTMYNGSLSGERYSTLNTITTANVSRLEQACAFETDDTVSFQSGIVAVRGTLYFTAFNNTYAVDGATCALKWKQSRPEPPTLLRVNRGVAFNRGMLFRGTGDGHVLGIDAASGQVRWDVAIADPSKGESVPAAPIAWNDLVFIGNAGGDMFGVVGRIYALEAATGKTVWEFKTVPDSGPARATWPHASPENPPTGGATWTSYALDELTGTLYVTTGNPAPDFVIELRPGDNLYTNSVLALDARTGELQGYVQPIRRDFHDWDVAAAPALITTKRGMTMVIVGAKDGMVYGIERGRPARATGDATTSEDTLALGIRYATATTTRENVNTALSAERFTRFCPGTQGGIEWNGPAYHRASGTVFVNSIDWCTSVKLQRLDTLRGTPGKPWTGMDDDQMAFGKMDPPSMWKGWVTAINAEDGMIRWKVQTPKPMVAGITATAGGLVFTGDLDGQVVAYDVESGKVLWRRSAGGAIGGGVITFEAGGTQRIAAAAGLNSPIWPVTGGPARVVVYALPAR